MRSIRTILMLFLQILLTVGGVFSAYANTRKDIDSVKAVVAASSDKEQIIRCYFNLGLMYTGINTDTSLLYINKALDGADEIHYYKAKILSQLSQIQITLGNYDVADSSTNVMLEEAKSRSDTNFIAHAYYLYGLSNDYQANFSDAISDYIKAIKLYEKIDGHQGIVNCHINIGVVYYFEHMYDKSIEQYKMAGDYAEAHGIQGVREKIYNNIATIFYQNEKLDSALVYYMKSAAIMKEKDDKSDYATIIGNIGLTYDEIGEPKLALKYHSEALALHRKLNNSYGIATTLKDMGKLYNHIGNYDSAIVLLEQAVERTSEMNAMQVLVSTYNHLSTAHFGAGNYKEAYQFLRLHERLNDSLMNAENAKSILEVEEKYKSAKKEAQILELENKEKLKDTRIRNQRIYIILGITGTLIILVFLFVIYQRLKLTRKQKLIIEEQKEEVETQRDEIERQRHEVNEKNEEIISSITYARRIQEAILPPDIMINNHLPNSSVLYIPKDVVAGDFYWMEAKENKVFFAVADCTGHGVPGAMVSVVCHSALNRCIREYELENPDLILNTAREIVVKTFEKSAEQVQDGMDISLACLDLNTNLLRWAGANNPLYLIRNGALEIVKGDREPVGYTRNPNPFTLQTLPLKPGDVLYLFSDGIADQFGGERNKKYGYKQFREKLVEIHQQTAHQQIDFIRKEFLDWVGSGKEGQIDDVCLWVIKI